MQVQMHNSVLWVRGCDSGRKLYPRALRRVLQVWNPEKNRCGTADLRPHVSKVFQKSEIRSETHRAVVGYHDSRLCLTTRLCRMYRFDVRKGRFSFPIDFDTLNWPTLII